MARGVSLQLLRPGVPVTFLSVTTSKPLADPTAPLWCGSPSPPGRAGHAWHGLLNTLLLLLTFPRTVFLKHAHLRTGTLCNGAAGVGVEGGYLGARSLAGVPRPGVGPVWFGGTLMRGWSQSSAR